MQRICQDIKIVFIGTPEFGTIILEKLIEDYCRPILVITAPDKLVGRKQILTPPPAKISAKKYNIPVLQPEILTNSKSKILNSKPDLIVAVAYGQIIPKEILDIPKYGCLNVHPSLLPKYRGPSPIQTAILNGDAETGITIIKITEKLDAGPIIAQKEIMIGNDETYQTLHDKLARLGANLLAETIPGWISGKIKPRAQDDSEMIYTKIIRKEDGKIDWRNSAGSIECQIRALKFWPGSYCKWKVVGKEVRILKILEAKVFPGKTNRQIGEVFFTKDRTLAVQTGKNCLIVKELQLEGKNKMTAREFLNGHPEIVGSVLE